MKKNTMIYDPDTKFVNLVYVLSTWGIENPKEMIEKYIAGNLSDFNGSDEENESDAQEWNDNFHLEKIYPLNGDEPEYYFHINDTLYVARKFLGGVPLLDHFNDTFPCCCFIDTKRLGVALMNDELFCPRLWEIWIQLESDNFKELMDMVKEREMILKQNKRDGKRIQKSQVKN